MTTPPPVTISSTPRETGAVVRPAPVRISVVVPAYNEGANLPPLLEELSGVLDALTPTWGVIVVDDGSTDDTLLRLAALPNDGRRVDLRLSRNFGKEVALAAGLDEAQGDVVVFMDADGQHPPGLMADMLARWREGVDMVYAVRGDRSDEGWLKRTGTRLFYALMGRLSGIELPAHAGDFRLMDRRVADALRALPERNRYMKGLYAWVGFRSEGLPYVPRLRRHGESRFGWRRLALLALDGLTSFTTFPLRLWMTLGSVLALGALGYGVYLLIESLEHGQHLPGWPTLAVGMMFLGGVQLLSIGVLGQYIGRVFDEVKHRPLYIVERRQGGGLARRRKDDVAQAGR